MIKTALKVDASAPGRADFLQDVLRGLAADEKNIPCKYLYDETGARLFETICTLDEYYPTTVEMEILTDFAPEMAAHLGERAVLVEYGCGALAKVRVVLDALDEPSALVAIDISSEQLEAAAAALQDAYPGVRTVPVVADFTEPVDLSGYLDGASGARCAFFPGSTIGNFEPDAAKSFLQGVRKTIGDGGYLLIGVDLKKDEHILHDAYDDPTGVTSAFAKNLLARINRELGGNFDLRDFDYRAVYEAEAGRVNMHLVSLQDQLVTVAGKTFRFLEGETVHTENSYKYDVPEFHALAGTAGFKPVQTWRDGRGLFAVYLLSAA